MGFCSFSKRGINMNLLLIATINLFAISIPCHILAYYPFRNRVHFNIWKIFVAVLILQVINSLYYGYSIMNGHSGLKAQYSFALIYMIIYFYCVKDDKCKVLFLYFFVTDYVLILRGLSAFLEARFFYSDNMTFYSLRSTLIHTIIFLISIPFMLHFFSKAKTQVFSIDAPLFWRTAWLLPAFNTTIVILFTGNFDLKQVYTFRFLFARTLLLLCVFVIYFILLQSFDSIKKQATLAEQSAMQEHLLNLQKKQQEQILKYMEQTKTARHDLKQHLNVMRAYTENNNIKALQCYLNSYEQTLSYDNYKIYCKNFAVNAILNYYGEEALKYYIDYDVVCNLDETLPVSEAELCALIGNLIENAVECCKNITDKKCFIKIRSVCEKNYIAFTVDNTCEKEPVLENGRFLSTKHEGYGTGTYSVTASAERNGGTAKFHYTDGVFFASVLLYG